MVVKLAPYLFRSGSGIRYCDHEILLARLETDIDITANALSLFRSFLIGRTQVASCGDQASSSRPVT